MAATHPTARDARDLLGVAADACPEDVTRAFRRLVRTHHPDVSLEPDASERFAAILSAYAVALEGARRRPPPEPDPDPEPDQEREPELEPDGRVTAHPSSARRFTARPRPARVPAPPLVAGPPVVRPFRREGR